MLVFVEISVPVPPKMDPIIQRNKLCRQCFHEPAGFQLYAALPSRGSMTSKDPFPCDTCRLDIAVPLSMSIMNNTLDVFAFYVDLFMSLR